MVSLDFVRRVVFDVPIQPLPVLLMIRSPFAVSLNVNDNNLGLLLREIYLYKSLTYLFTRECHLKENTKRVVRGTKSSPTSYVSWSLRIEK